MEDIFAMLQNSAQVHSCVIYLRAPRVELTCIRRDIVVRRRSLNRAACLLAADSSLSPRLSFSSSSSSSSSFINSN